MHQLVDHFLLLYSGLYYKNITIVNDNSRVMLQTVASLTTYLTTLAMDKVRGNKTFIVKSSFMIITYNHQNILIVEATSGTKYLPILVVKWMGCYPELCFDTQAYISCRIFTHLATLFHEFVLLIIFRIATWNNVAKWVNILLLQLVQLSRLTKRLGFLDSRYL